MGSVYRRGNKLWIKYRGADGEIRRHTTPFAVGDERKARALLRRTEGKIAAALDAGETGPLTVAEWTKRWIEERKALVVDWQNDQGRLEHHVLPELGPLELEAVRPRHLIALFRRLRIEAKIAPKTIRSVYGVVRSLFRDAVRSELMEATPCVLTRQDLGPAADKDPEWRAHAVFTRAELETLIADERIATDHAVLYALEGLAGLRHGEAAGLRWRHLESDAKPLGRLTIATSYDRGRTKTSTPRLVPVHPTLAAVLAAWKLEGWPKAFGRAPKPDDLVLPAVPGGKAPVGSIRKPFNSWLALQVDLDNLELRRRRQHDLRRTFITLARADGARADILRVITHGPPRDMIDLYTTWPWSSLCAEVSKLNVRRRGIAEVAEAKRAAVAGAQTVPSCAQRRIDRVRGHSAGHSRAGMAMMMGASVASPTGFESLATDGDGERSSAVSRGFSTVMEPSTDHRMSVDRGLADRPCAQGGHSPEELARAALAALDAGDLAEVRRLLLLALEEPCPD